jgi:hypothetical protein
MATGKKPASDAGKILRDPILLLQGPSGNVTNVTGSIPSS